MARPAGKIGNNYDGVGWTASADWLRGRFKRGTRAGNLHPGTSPVRSRLSANLRNSRATGLGPYSATASLTVTATPSRESLAFSCRSNQCLIDNATYATSSWIVTLHRSPAPRPETHQVNSAASGRASEKASSCKKNTLLLWPRKRAVLRLLRGETQTSHPENLRTHNRYKRDFLPLM